MNRVRRGDLWVGLALAAVVLAFFWPWLAAPSQTLYSPWSDVVVQFNGWKSFMVGAWADGHGVAFWNPSYFCGTPAYANPQYLWAHPLHFLFHLMPVDRAVAPTFALYVLSIGIGTHVWLRLCGLDVLSAGIGALAGAIAPRLLYHVAGGFLPYLLGVTFLPWTFAAVEYACRRPSAWRWALVAFVLSLMASSSFMQLWLYAGYVLVLYVCLRPAAGWHPDAHADPPPVHRRVRAVGALAAAYAASLALAAYHFWPAYRFAQQTTRGGSLAFERVVDVSVTGWHWLTLAVPQPWGDPTRMLAVGDGAWLMWEQNVSFGLVPLLLVFVGRRGPHRRLWLALAGMLCVCFLFAGGAGSPLFASFYRLPGIARFRFPVRMLFVAGVLISGLTATAVNTWLAGAGNVGQRLRVWGYLPVLLLLLAVAAFVHAQGEHARMVATAARDMRWALGAVAVLVAAIVVSRRRNDARWAVGALGVLMLADSMRSAGWAVRMEDPAVVYPENAPIRTLRSMAGVNRVVDQAGAIHKGMPGRTGLQIPDGYDPLQLAHTVRYMRALTGDPEQGAGNDLRLQPTEAPRLFELLGAPYLLSTESWPRTRHGEFHDVATFQFWQGVGTIPDPVYLYAYERAMPRAFVVGPARHVTVPQEEAELRELYPRTEVLLAEAPPIIGTATFAAAEITEYTPNRVTVRATSDGPGYLVLTDAWYPAWVATRNGESTRVLRADGMFRAVALPAAGEWTVEFRYVPRAETQGAVVTAGALFAFGVLGVRARRRG